MQKGQRNWSARTLASYAGLWRQALATVFWSTLLIGALLSPLLSHSQQQNPSEEVLTGELMLHYAYVTPPRQAVTGKALDVEYAKAVAVALDGLAIPADQVQIDPLFEEIVDEMRSKNLTESLAILSLIEKYKTTSDRFLTSPFFSRLQTRPYNFVQVVVVKFPMPAKTTMDQLVDRIASRRVRQRANNLIITPLPITITPVVGSRVDADGGSPPKQLTLCEKNPPKVAIIGDQFVAHRDLPQLSSLPFTAPTAIGCDTTPYTTSTESYGTNLAGAVAAFCPNCPIIGIDVGCSRNSRAFLRSSDAIRGLVSAILRDVSIVLLTTAERSIDPLFSSIIRAALDARVMLVAPAGDRASRESHHPAATGGIFGVGARDATGSRAAFSNHGPWVATSAPGVSVPALHGPAGSMTLSSTGIAAAHFSGLLARYLALNPKARVETLPSVILSREFLLPSAQSCPEGSSPGSGQSSSPPAGSSGTAPVGSGASGSPAGSTDSSSPPPSTGGSSPTSPEQPSAPAIPDACPQDSAKSQPGICGCGVADTDSDGDTAPDCKDSCPSDPNKTSAGTCGCGVADTDSDGDTAPDCKDSCPSDPNKTSAGTCGCGVADTDSDGDTAPDCKDSCPSDPNKTSAGICGCGVAESNCSKTDDLCPQDPAKTKPGVCGCGNPDLDTNKNNTIDCLENSQFLGKSNNDSPFNSETIATTSNNANKVIAFELSKEDKTLTELLKTLGVPSAGAPNLQAENALVRKDTKLDLIVDYAKATSCPQAQTGANIFAELFQSKAFAANVAVYGKATLSVGAEPFTVPQDTTVGALRAAISNSACPGAIVGATDPAESTSKLYVNGSFTDPAAPQQKNYLEATKFEKAYDYFKKNSTSSVVVAFIDTGFDLAAQNRDVTKFSDIMVGSNLVPIFEKDRSNPDLPQDTDGHGTMVASIAAAAENNSKGIAGLAAGTMTVLPIRILRDTTAQVGTRRLVEGIRLAVNAGAKIVNISLNQAERYYADVFVGEAIFRAIEKGVTFVFAAGDGIEDDNKVKFPIELKSPSDFGIQRFGRTMTPAAWGLYFKGALTVGGLETGRDELYLKSNYGPSAELAAPATNISSVALNGAIKTGTGTSFAAPMVTAAAAIVYSHFTAKGFRISPWLLEDIVLNAMPSRESLQSTVRNGKVVDFEALKDYLAVLSEMREEERAQIPSDNQDSGTGWDPNRDIERIAEVIVDAPDATSLIAKGQQIQLRALARYTDGSTQDVTNHPNIFWTVQYEPDGFTSVTPKGGLVSVRSSAQLELGSTIRVIAHYKTDYQGTFELLFDDKDSLPPFNKFGIVLTPDGSGAGRGSRVTWGKTAQYKVFGTYTTRSGKDVSVDLTQVADVVSSKPDELMIDQTVKGLLRTTKTFGGSTYTLKATYKNQSAESSLTVDKLQATLEIRNALGDPYKGQPLTLRAALVAPTLPEDLVLKADWKSTTTGINVSQSNVSEITIMTEDLPIGTYGVEASAEFRGMGENARVTARHTFGVLSSVMRMELLTKTPILGFQSRGVFVLRLYNRNNSFSVVDPRKVAWSTSSPDLKIDGQGIIQPTDKSVKDAKPTTYTVFADYLGQRVSAPVAISPTNTVNGTQAQLSHIVVNAEWNRKLRCSTATPKPGCERIVASGTDSLISGLQAIAYYSDGRTRDITRYATWSTSHPYMTGFVMNAQKYSMRIGPESRPGDVVRITALYEGQQASHLITIVPVKDVLLEAPKQGTPIDFDTAQNRDLPKAELIIINESGDQSSTYGEIRKPVVWSSSDPHVVAAIKGLNIPIRANDELTVDTKKLPPGNSYPISLTYSYEGYGLKKMIQANYLLRNTAVQPTGLKLELNNSLWNWNFREKAHFLTCSLEYAGRPAVEIPCSGVNLRFSMSDGSSPPTDVTQDVYLSQNYFTSSDTETTSQISRRIFPTSFLITIPENSDRLFTVEGTHKTLGFKAAPQTGYFVGIERIDSTTPLGPLPTEAPVKADDPFCNEERRKLSPVAGGRGTKDDPLVVCTPRQLMEVSKATGKESFDYFVALKANLDFSGVVDFTPIQLNDYSASRAGRARTLLGNGYRISNVTLIDRERDNLAIFAETVLDVQDLIIDKAVIRGDTSVGIIAGDGRMVSASNVQIIRSSVQGTRRVGAISGDRGWRAAGVFVKDSQISFEQGEAGCIFGQSFRGSITNSVCLSTAIAPVGVQGTQRAIGGLVGSFQEGESLLDLPPSSAGKRLPLIPSSAWLSNPKVHIFNSHFSGSINAGLSVTGNTSGQSAVGGLVGDADSIGIVNSSAKAEITSLGSDVGGLVGSFRCSSRNAGIGFLLGSSFEGSITGGQALSGLSNAGGLIGALMSISFKSSCMIIRNKVSGTVRGRNDVGGLVGRAASGNRFLENEVSVNVASSTERHGGFIGSLESNRLRLYRVKDKAEFILDDIYQGNSWRYTGTGKVPFDVGTSDVRPDARSGLDVAGVDRR